MNLVGKAAVITGGASGLGLATAKNFIENGAQVLIADYSDAGQAIADELGCEFIKTDVTKEEDIIAMVDRAVEKFGKIDITVASAGIGGDQHGIVNSSLQNWERVNAVDYTGVFLTDKYTITQMLKQGNGGSVINLASMFGLVAVPDNISYSASKGGVVNLTRAAGTEYAEQGIRVNAVCPGVIDTPLIPEEAKVLFSKRHPMGRLGTADEVAKLINFLACDDSRFISGAAIPIDGGYTAI